MVLNGHKPWTTSQKVRTCVLLFSQQTLWGQAVLVLLTLQRFPPSLGQLLVTGDVMPRRWQRGTRDDKQQLSGAWKLSAVPGSGIDENITRKNPLPSFSIYGSDRDVGPSRYCCRSVSKVNTPTKTKSIAFWRTPCERSLGLWGRLSFTMCIYFVLLLSSSSSFFLGLSSSCCFQSFICFTTENPQENLFSPWIHAGLGGSAVFFPPPVGGRTLFYRHDKAEGWVSKVAKVNAPKTTWSKSSAAVPVPVSDSFPTHVSHQWHGASITQPAAWHMFNLSLCSSWWRVQGAIRIHQRQFPNSILMGRANTTRYDMTNPSWDKKHKGDPCPCREHLPVSQMEHYHTARAQGRHISVAQKWLQ